jgi:putative Ca2+/H+ antiporter (TMEM165/GDT1 family)
MFISFISEFGDKTQLAALALAMENSSPIWVLSGAGLGVFLADILGIVIGVVLKKSLPKKFLNIFSAILFFIFGILEFAKIIIK